MYRFCGAMLFLAAVSSFLHADCQPDKDFRTNKTGGIEVVDVNFSGANTVDSADLEEITNYLIGACFDEKEWKFDETVYNSFSNAGYLSARIENLRTEPINQEVMPTPVWVKGNVIEGWRCPRDTRAAYEFLLDSRSDSRDVDPACVDSTLARLSFKGRFADDRDFYIKALVNLLDFERRDEDPGVSHHFVQYPATESLHFSAALPYLIDAIKQSDSELVRKNAVDTLLWMETSRECMGATVGRLNQEAQKLETTPDQKIRLEMAAEYAAEYIKGFNAGRPDSCRSANGEPSTEEQVWKELERESAQWDGHEAPQPR